MHVPIDFLRTAGSLQMLAASLGGMDEECGSLVESVSQEFQSLTQHTSEILRMARLAAESIEAGGVPSIPAKVEKLIKGVQTFVRERLDSSSAVLGVIRNEQELVERLLRIHGGNRSIAQEMRLLRVLTGIEVARLGEAGGGFRHLVQELEVASESVAESSREFSARARERNRTTQDARRKMAAALPRLREQFEEIESQLESSLTDVERSVEDLSKCPAEFKACVETVAGRISGVVSAIQSHDITRQQNEHVRLALAALAARLNSADESLNTREIALALRIQVYQGENITRTMNAWTSQMDECLESILHVSQSRLERVSQMVLAQEKALFGRLVGIEEIERECDSDNAEIEEAFSGLSSLLALVQEHSQIARITRDRLQLLSFNSMIESRNLGGRVDVMLEVSRNVVRIASQWAEMAEKSAATQTEMQRLMEQARAGIATQNGGKKNELRTARLEVVNVLAGLKSAAQANAAHAAEMGDLTAALRAQIEAARCLSHSLQEVTRKIGRTMEEVGSLQQAIEALQVGGECDLRALEEAYSEAYTTEIERGILQAALYGEPLPACREVSAGNDVELFRRRWPEQAGAERSQVWGGNEKNTGSR
jgi:hypothetical protein